MLEPILLSGQFEGVNLIPYGSHSVTEELAQIGTIIWAGLIFVILILRRGDSVKEKPDLIGTTICSGSATHGEGKACQTPNCVRKPQRNADGR